MAWCFYFLFTCSLRFIILSLIFRIYSSLRFFFSSIGLPYLLPCVLPYLLLSPNFPTYYLVVFFHWIYLPTSLCFSSTEFPNLRSWVFSSAEFPYLMYFYWSFIPTSLCFSSTDVPYLLPCVFLPLIFRTHIFVFFFRWSSIYLLPCCAFLSVILCTWFLMFFFFYFH